MMYTIASFRRFVNRLRDLYLNECLVNEEVVMSRRFVSVLFVLLLALVGLVGVVRGLNGRSLPQLAMETAVLPTNSQWKRPFCPPTRKGNGRSALSC